MIKPIIYPLREKIGLKRTGGQIMAEKKNIYETISAVMSEVGAIGKNSKNEQQKFMFRGIDAVMNALAPALQKNKLFIVPEVLDQTREERMSSKGNAIIYSICRVKYTFYAEDGSSISATVIGEGMDSGDKATNKAMSIAFKYACFQVFCIPTEEMVDPDAECHEVKVQKKSGIKTEEEMKATETQTIDTLALTAVKARLAETSKQLGRALDEEALCKMLGCESLDKMTYPQLRVLNENIDRWMGAKK